MCYINVLLFPFLIVSLHNLTYKCKLRSMRNEFLVFYWSKPPNLNCNKRKTSILELFRPCIDLGISRLNCSTAVWSGDCAQLCTNSNGIHAGFAESVIVAHTLCTMSFRTVFVIHDRGVVCLL